jgi:hypothetical protein
MTVKPLVLALVIGLGATLAPPADARGMSRAWSRAMAAVLKRDAARDAATAAKPLAQPRTVWRYTSKAQAERELQRGVPAGGHLTAGTTAGRLPSPERAQARYGLPARPEVRETVRLPAGHPVRSNKTLCGDPGVGEITSTHRLPPATIHKVQPLPGARP